MILFYTNMAANKYYYYFLMVSFLGPDLIWVTFCVGIPTQYYLLFLLSHPIEDLGTYCFCSVSYFFPFLSFFLSLFLSPELVRTESRRWTVDLFETSHKDRSAPEGVHLSFDIF